MQNRRRAELILVAASTLLALGMAEAGLRVFAPVTVDPPTGNPLAGGWEYRQNLPGLRPVIVYQRNKYGLRSRAIGSKPKEPGDVRVVCLGASTTDQPTQNLEDTWCDLLGVALNRDYAAPGVRYQTGSFGRGGYRVTDDLAWAEDSLAALQPDLVVLLLGINDLAYNGGPEYRYIGLDSALARSRIQRGSASTAPTDTLPSLGRRLCSARLQLCRRAILLSRRLAGGQALEWHSANLPHLRQAYRDLPSVRAVARDPDPIVEFRDGVDSLVGLLASRGVDIVLLGQPVLWSATMAPAEQAVLWFSVATPEGKLRPDGEWLAREMARYNKAQEAVARERGVPFLDLNGRVPRTLEYLFDDCHFTDLGSRRVAEELLPVVGPRARDIARARAGQN
jgi:lysophospholipase L1-like esterase